MYYVIKHTNNTAYYQTRSNSHWDWVSLKDATRFKTKPDTKNIDGKNWSMYEYIKIEEIKEKIDDLDPMHRPQKRSIRI